MDDRSIGVFDSGLGGLTAVKEIMKILPNEDLIYFGDTGRVPYGSRSRETIIKYSKEDIRFLESFDVKLVVVACGTVSSTALPELLGESKVPIIGVVEPAAAAALEKTKNKRVGIIGTAGTVRSHAYSDWIHKRDPEVKTFPKSCPLFVPLVENGHFDTQVARLVVEEYLSEIKEAGVDTLILGCTHYPLLKKAIADFMGSGVELIDSGAQIAKAVKSGYPDLMTGRDKRGKYRYFVSDDVDNFEHLASAFLQCDVNGQVMKIDIEKY